MRLEDFSETAPGRVVEVIGGGVRTVAFVPDPLPPELQWTAVVVGLLSEADRALGQLAGVARNLPNPRLLIGAFKRREAVLSSRIEGTQASAADLLLFEAQPRTEPAVGDVREVANYVRALEHGLKRLRDLPISLRLIREVHEVLLSGVRGHEQAAGAFRTTQNWIGPAGASIDDATFVPPPTEMLPALLDRFERYLHDTDDLPPLVRLACIHYQFEALHPFLDGNGRIGRLLITLLLCAEGILLEPLLYLSVYFERHRDEYYRRLLQVSQHGDWEGWIAFFLRGVREQALDAVGRASRLVALRDEYHHRLHAARSSALPLKLVDQLFESPAINSVQAVELLDVTTRTALLNIGKLEDAKILTEVTGQRRNRVWVAPGILEVIE